MIRLCVSLALLYARTAWSNALASSDCIILCELGCVSGERKAISCHQTALFLVWLLGVDERHRSVLLKDRRSASPRAAVPQSHECSESATFFSPPPFPSFASVTSLHFSEQTSRLGLPKTSHIYRHGAIFQHVLQKMYCSKWLP